MAVENKIQDIEVLNLIKDLKKIMCVAFSQSINDITDKLNAAQEGIDRHHCEESKSKHDAIAANIKAIIEKIKLHSLKPDIDTNEALQIIEIIMKAEQIEERFKKIRKLTSIESNQKNDKLNAVIDS